MKHSEIYEFCSHLFHLYYMFLLVTSTETTNKNTGLQKYLVLTKELQKALPKGQDLLPMASILKIATESVIMKNN